MRLTATPRVQFLRELADEISFNYGAGRVIVAVDGIDGAGKSVFAETLADVFRERGRETFLASIEDFHRPRAERYRLGETSPEGFYRDSFDYRTLRRALIDPFRMAGSTGFQPAAFDVARDAPVGTRWETADADALLIVEGVFLNRPELRGIWNYSIFLDVPWDIAYERLAVRDGRDPDPDAPANSRYRRGQELYFADASPKEAASAIVDNTDPERPKRIFADSC